MGRKFSTLDQINRGIARFNLIKLPIWSRFVSTLIAINFFLLPAAYLESAMAAQKNQSPKNQSQKNPSESADTKPPSTPAGSNDTLPATLEASASADAATTDPERDASGSSTDQVPLTEAEILKEAPTIRAPAPVKDDSPARGRYTRPLLFAPEDNKIKFTSPQIVWDLSQGTKIYLGGIVIESAAIRMVLTQPERDKVASRYRVGGRGDSTVTILSFRWPTILTNVGTLSIETPQDKSLWETRISAETRDEWKSHLRYDVNKILAAHTESSFALFDLDLNATPWLKDGSQIKYCLTQKNPQSEKLRICSNVYVVARTDKSLQLTPRKVKKTAQVAINGSDIGPRGIVNFPEEKNIEIKITFSDNARIELSSRPLQLKFLDVVKTKDGRTLLLTGQGAKPVGKVKNLEVPPNHFWSATGMEKEIIWQVSTPITQPTLRVLGAWNIPFTYLIKYDDLPSEQDRMFINTRTGSGTYVNGAHIRAYSASGGTVVSKEQSTKRKGKNEYTWFFAAPNKGTNNKSRLILDTGSGLAGEESQKWVVHYQLYRGFPYEFSSRLTGIVTPAVNEEGK